MNLRIVLDDALLPALTSLAQKEMRTVERQASFLFREALLRAMEPSEAATAPVDVLAAPVNPLPVARGRPELTTDEERRLGPVGVERWRRGVCLCPTCPTVAGGLGLCQRHYAMMYYSRKTPKTREWFVRHGKMLDRAIVVEEREDSLEDLPRLPRGSISPEKAWLFDAQETIRKRRELEQVEEPGKQ